MSLKGLIKDTPCRKCGERPALGGFPGSYWWCHKCNKEVTSE
ncbi:hypothetical protein OUHCRE19_42430 [Enterobacter asburiae]